jgi:hypothetical protein
MGFDTAFDELVTAARSLGVAVFAQSGAFAGGQLGWFTERLSTHGLVALGAINSNALLDTAPGTGRVLGTNPMSYSFPRMGQQVMTVDQSSSAAAYVNVRDAAARGEQIPAGWALDATGQPTTDSEAALDGALLPFGGYKGANIAWMVELLAGMSGANWSIDAPSFDSGSEHPGVGMFILALDPSKLQHDFVARADAHRSSVEQPWRSPARNVTRVAAQRDSGTYGSAGPAQRARRPFHSANDDSEIVAVRSPAAHRPRRSPALGVDGGRDSIDLANSRGKLCDLAGSTEPGHGLSWRSAFDADSVNLMRSAVYLIPGSVDLMPASLDPEGPPRSAEADCLAERQHNTRQFLAHQMGLPRLWLTPDL